MVNFFSTKLAFAKYSIVPVLFILITLKINVTHAQYFQQGQKLVGNNVKGASFQGISNAISGDGNTYIVGGSGENNSQGAAWIFKREEGKWAQSGPKLVGTGNDGGAYQGISVSLSEDGKTALVGGMIDSSNYGATWVFTFNNNIWTQQGPKLVGTGSIGGAYQGRATSLSADGNIALIGGNGDQGGIGAAWIFQRTDGVWKQLGEKLVPYDPIGRGSFGISVKFSSDASVAVIGSYSDSSGLNNVSKGAAYVFERSGDTWLQKVKLHGTGNIGLANQGGSVSISGDGKTIVVGGHSDNQKRGAVWTFIKENEQWVQTSKITCTDHIKDPEFGGGVAISRDGNTLVVGGGVDDTQMGATWIYKRKGKTWIQEGSKMIGVGNWGNAKQGSTVCVSNDGSTAICGAVNDNTIVGASWVFEKNWPDLTFQKVQLANDSVNIGDSTFINFTIANIGETKAYKPVSVHAILSLDSVYDSSDKILKDSIIIQSLELKSEIHISSAKLKIHANESAGKYFLLLIANKNNQNEEPLIGNNIKVLPITLVATPDLDVIDLKVKHSTIDRGDSLILGFNLFNKGNKTLSSKVSIEYYLSTNNIFEPLDTLFEKFEIHVVLDPKSSKKIFDKKYRIPITTLPGKYYLFTIIDSNNRITESDESNNTEAVPITIIARPLINSGNLSQKFLSNLNPTLVNFAIKTHFPIQSLQATYRKITDTITYNLQLTNTSLLNYSFSIPANVDEIGIEYNIIAVDSAGNIGKSLNNPIYMQFANPGLTIPYNNFGKEQINYRIIAIPLNTKDSTISIMLESQLGKYDRTKWRIFNYNTVAKANLEYKSSDLNLIQPGIGYWFVSKTAPGKNLITNSGTVAKATADKPFSIPLFAGWNQIGNPYNMHLSWKDILNYKLNDKLNLGKFYRFDGKWEIDTIVRKMQGGFVFASANDTLYFPTYKNKKILNTSLRLASHGQEMNENNWELNLSLISESATYDLGGFGMNDLAKNSKDEFDDLTPPRFGDWLEINFEHPEFFYSKFTKDIVTSSLNYKWSFDVNSSSLDNKTLQWNNAYIKQTSKEFILFDTFLQKRIDMGSTNYYTFNFTDSRHFEVFYGNREFISAALQPNTISLHNISPNPVSTSTTISFSLPGSTNLYEVQLNILNAQGNIICNIVSEQLANGFFEYNWEPRDLSSNNIPPGLYFVSLKVANEASNKIFNQKIIVE